MRHSLLVVLTLIISCLNAQNEIIVNQYSQNLFALNPAYSSLSGQSEANLYYKKLWSGFADSPDFSQLTLSGPVRNKKIGLGLNVSYQQVGIFSYLHAQGAFAYRVKLNDINFLSFGLQAGIRRLQINFDKINALHTDELIDFPRQQASTRPTADFSVCYKRKDLYIFAAANQLLGGKFKYQDPTYQPTISSQIVAYYVAGVRWDAPLSNTFSNSATAIYRSHQGLPVQLEVSDIVTWNNKISAGLGFRQSYSLYALARFQITPNLLAGYSYEYGLNKLNQYTSGGHEINICYRFGSLRGHKEEEGSKKSSSRKVAELQEDIDLVNQKQQQSDKRVDSLDKNVQSIRQEMKTIQKQSLNPEDTKRMIDSLNSGRNNLKCFGKKCYGAIVKDEDAAKYKDQQATYSVVLAVHRVFKFAKDYQKVLLRDHSIETDLIQLDNVENGYYYVVQKKTFTNQAEAIAKMKQTRSDLDKKEEKLTNGQPWLLVTIEN